MARTGRGCRGVALLAALSIALTGLQSGCASQAPPAVVDQANRYTEVVELPEPIRSSEVSLEQALESRRSGRSYGPDPLALDEIGQLLWAAQGVTDDAGHRTAPSAGALYPLELFVAGGDGFLHYLPDDHTVERRTTSVVPADLVDAAFQQEFVGGAFAVVVVAGLVERTEARYGALAHDLMNREAGHAVQNLLLQATAMGVSAVPVGGFDPPSVAELLALPPGHEVLYLIPVGRPGP